jgi:hypothetical protein
MAHGCRFGFPFGGARCVGCGVVRYFPPFQDPEGFRIFFGSKEVFVSFEFASERFSYLLDPKGFRIFWIQKVFVSFLKMAGRMWREITPRVNRSQHQATSTLSTQTPPTTLTHSTPTTLIYQLSTRYPSRQIASASASIPKTTLTMKTSALVITALSATLSQTHAFIASSSAASSSSRTTISAPTSIYAPSHTTTPASSSSGSSSLNMFSGNALDVEEEEDDEKRAQIEQMAKAMGMSVEEYQLGMNARARMESSIDDLRVVGGDISQGVSVERDGNMPPKHLVVTVTESGKAMGKAKLEKALVDALKSASEKSKVGRTEAQKDMMKYISDSMKKMGAM